MDVDMVAGNVRGEKGTCQNKRVESSKKSVKDKAALE
jgi:hypothetical protein